MIFFVIWHNTFFLLLKQPLLSLQLSVYAGLFNLRLNFKTALSRKFSDNNSKCEQFISRCFKKSNNQCTCCFNQPYEYCNQLTCKSNEPDFGYVFYHHHKINLAFHFLSYLRLSIEIPTELLFRGSNTTCVCHHHPTDYPYQICKAMYARDGKRLMPVLPAEMQKTRMVGELAL